MKTLQDIYTYLNDRLLEGNLGGIKEVIDYLNEGQTLISQKFPVEAPKLTVTLTTNSFSIPSDMETLKKIKRGTTELTEIEMWAGIITLNSNIKDGTIDVYYYKTPTPLDDTNVSQVPDIDSRYFYALAKFAAEAYYLVDDDPEMREAFKAAFVNNLSTMAPKHSVTKFVNGW